MSLAGAAMAARAELRAAAAHADRRAKDCLQVRFRAHTAGCAIGETRAKETGESVPKNQACTAALPIARCGTVQVKQKHLTLFSREPLDY